MDFVGMALSESDGSILLHVQPAQGRGDIDAAALHDWLVREGYGDCRCTTRRWSVPPRTPRARLLPSRYPLQSAVTPSCASMLPRMPCLPVWI